MRTILRFALLAAMAACRIQCSNTLAGNGSEIVNGCAVAGGAPCSGAMIIAYPVDYDPSGDSLYAPETTYADGNGHFTLDLTGAHNLLLIDSSLARGAFVRTIDRDSILGEIVLLELGAIRGNILADATDPRVEYVITIPGSPFVSRGIQPAFQIERVPPQQYSIRVERIESIMGSDPSHPSPPPIVSSVEVEAAVPEGDTASVGDIQLP